MAPTGRRSMREEIVDAAVSRFHLKGYIAAGVKDITDAAGGGNGAHVVQLPTGKALTVRAAADVFLD